MDEFEKRYQAAKKRAEDPSIEMAEQMGRVPSGTTRKNMMEFEAMEKERQARSKKDPFSK